MEELRSEITEYPVVNSCGVFKAVIETRSFVPADNPGGSHKAWHLNNQTYRCDGTLCRLLSPTQFEMISTGERLTIV